MNWFAMWAVHIDIYVNADAAYHQPAVTLVVRTLQRGSLAAASTSTVCDPSTAFCINRPGRRPIAIDQLINQSNAALNQDLTRPVQFNQHKTAITGAIFNIDSSGRQLRIDMSR